MTSIKRYTPNKNHRNSFLLIEVIDAIGALKFESTLDYIIEFIDDRIQYGFNIDLIESALLEATSNKKFQIIIKSYCESLRFSFPELSETGYLGDEGATFSFMIIKGNYNRYRKHNKKPKRLPSLEAQQWLKEIIKSNLRESIEKEEMKILLEEREEEYRRAKSKLEEMVLYEPGISISENDEDILHQ